MAAQSVAAAKCKTPAVIAKIKELKARLDRYWARWYPVKEEYSKARDAWHEASLADPGGKEAGIWLSRYLKAEIELEHLDKIINDLTVQLFKLEALPYCEFPTGFPLIFPLPNGLGVITMALPSLDFSLGSRQLNSSMTNIGTASAIPVPNTIDRVSPPGTANLDSRSFYGEVGAGMNLWHVPTGLFVTNGMGAQLFVDTRAFIGWGNNGATVQGIAGTSPSIVSPANAQNDSMTSKATYDFGFLLQGGIKKNWFGPGPTSIYVQGGFGGVHFKDTITCSSGVGACGSNGLPGFSDTHESTPIVPIWGLGVAQRIDAAAMELFAEYKHFDTRSSTTTFGNGATSVGVTATFDHRLDIVTGGARIRF